MLIKLETKDVQFLVILFLIQITFYKCYENLAKANPLTSNVMHIFYHTQALSMSILQSINIIK
jgi:hypothetical protein